MKPSDTPTRRFDPTSIEAVCFDLDDTLFDFTQYVRQGLLNAADRIEARTGDTVHEELLELYFEEGIRKGTFDRLRERRGLDIPVDELVEAYHDSTGPLDPYKEAEAVLSRLDQAYDLGLVTDGRNGRDKLNRLGLAGHFDVVVVAHDHGLAKSEDPEAFKRALDELGVAHEDTVYVGDHPLADVRIPARLGMLTVRLRRGRYADRDPDNAAPDAEIDSLAALPGLLGVDADARNGRADRGRRNANGEIGRSEE